MDEVMKKVNQWWRDASPKKRGITLVALIGLVCTGLFLILTSMYQPAYTPVTTPADADKLDNPLYYFGVVAKTVAVILLIVGGAVVLKRFQNNQPGNRPERRLAIMETTRLSPRQALHLVRAGEKLYLIGATDQSIQFLATVQDAKSSPIEQNLPVKGLSFEAMLANETGLPVSNQIVGQSGGQASGGPR